MFPLGLSVADYRAFHSTLLTTHRIRTRVSIRTLDGDIDSDVTHLLIDGQVNVDSGAAVTRSCTLTLLDEHRALPFDTTSPANSALYMDRMIRVVYDVWVPTFVQSDGSIGDWIPVPLFTGPVTKLDRSGDFITVEAQGKEILAGAGDSRAVCWRPITVRKGTPKTAAIRTLMRQRAGETLFGISDLPPRLPRVLSLDREANVWRSAVRIARSLDRQLFYDGGGRLRLRPHPGTPHYTFTGQSVVGDIQVSHAADVINTVWVKGGKPKGAKSHVSYTVAAPASDPLSPTNLGRNDVPRHLLLTIENDAIRSHTEAKRVGDRRLRDGLRQGITASFDALPIPHIEPADLVRVHTGEASVIFRLATFSFPLNPTTQGTMTVGYLKDVSVGHRVKPR